METHVKIKGFRDANAARGYAASIMVPDEIVSYYEVDKVTVTKPPKLKAENDTDISVDDDIDFAFEGKTYLVVAVNILP